MPCPSTALGREQGHPPPRFVAALSSVAILPPGLPPLSRGQSMLVVQDTQNALVLTLAMCALRGREQPGSVSRMECFAGSSVTSGMRRTVRGRLRPEHGRDKVDTLLATVTH